MTDRRYWAREAPDKIAGLIIDRIKAYFDHLQSTKRLHRARKAFAQYYDTQSEVSFGGEQGEVVETQENHFADIVDKQVTLATATRPSYEARAANTDTESVDQAHLAENILDNDLAHEGLEEMLKRCARISRLAGEGWTYQGWDPQGGEPVKGLASGEVMTGAIDTQILSMLDVARDPRRKDCNHDWLAFRLPANRWDLIARFAPEAEGTDEQPGDPEQAKLAEAILNATPILSDRESCLWRDHETKGVTDVDQVETWLFVHRVTRAHREGRLVLVCGDKALLDVPTPYGKELPAKMLAEDVVPETCFGHSSAWNLLVPQDQNDAIASQMASSQDAFGMQLIAVIGAPTEGALTPEMATRALGIVRLPAGATVQALNLLNISEHSYRLKEAGVKTMGVLGSVNEITRGIPSENVKSGAHAALFEAQSMQGLSGFATACALHLGDVGTWRIELLKRFATAERLIEVAGEENTHVVERFTGERLKNVRRLIVQAGNPAMRGYHNRSVHAEKLLDTGKITIEQYFEFLDTGRYEAIDRYPNAAMRYVRWENQKLTKKGMQPCATCRGEGQDQRAMETLIGDPAAVPEMVLGMGAIPAPCPTCKGAGRRPTVQAIATEDHDLHIREHMVLQNDPSIREDPNDPRLEAVLAHIAEHEELKAAKLMQSQQAAAAAGVAPEVGPEGEPKSKAQGATNTEKPKAERAQLAGVGPGDTSAPLPLMPQNPATGQRTQSPQQMGG